MPQSDGQDAIGNYRAYLKAIAEAEFPQSLRQFQDTSDIVQDCLLKGVANADQFRGSTDKERAAWLKSILKNVVTDRLRHHRAGRRDIRRQVRLEDDAIPGRPAQDSAIIRKEDRQQQLSEAIQQLPDKAREVIGLRSQGLTFEEIGERLGRSADAARQFYARSILTLSRLIKKEE